MLDVPKGLKPGWYLIFVLLVFAVVASFGWRAAVVELREARMELAGRSPSFVAAGAVAASPEPPAAAQPSPEAASGTDAPSPSASGAGATPPAEAARTAEAAVAAEAARTAEAAVAAALAGDTGLWFPLPSARVPADDAHLPGAPRPYRAGVSEGFVFWPDGAGVPLAHGTPVIAAAAGEAIRVDAPYAELDEATWEALLVSVADGADDHELDALRGRQVWIRLDDGRVLRYGHLSGVRPGLSVGQRVGRGRVVGYVGNSGTFDGVVGRTTNARLHFEIRDGDGFVGEGLDADGVRWLAASLFTGP